jgi:hypothetical protein
LKKASRMNAVVKPRPTLPTPPVSEEPEVQADPKGWGMLRKVLLVCGILSSLLYGTMITAIRYEATTPSPK